MFDPDWDEGCESCSFLADGIGHAAHLHARDTTLAMVSRAPLPKIEAFRQRMSWTVPSYARGTDMVNSTYQWLDLTARGRQEDWEHPSGRSDGPLLSWLRHHDRYDA